MNDGFKNEKELENYISNNLYNQYNKNIKDFLSFIFKENLNPNLPFYAKKISGQVKPDIYICHNNIKKYVSIKKGSGNSVHQEKIEIFFPFFCSLLNKKYEEALKKFHYGDDTINDSGSIRFSATECKKRYKTDIDFLNKKLNEWCILKFFLDRFLFLGNIGNISVDFIYYGTIEKGCWASKEEIICYIKNEFFSINGIHFGPLTYQVWGRNENKTAKHPDRRYIMQIKWGSLEKDLIKIRKQEV